MSLINDALKRARQAQPPPSAAPVPQLRPAEPTQRRTANMGLIVLLVVGMLVVFGGLGAFFVLHGLHHRGPAPQVVAPSPTAPAREPPLQSQTAAPAAALPRVLPSPSLAPASPAPIVAPTTPERPAVALPPVPAGATVATESNPPPAGPIPESPPKPPPPKLQGIYYRPGRPSAVVSGRTLFIGDRMGAYHVRAITSDSVTLVGADQTLVLSLSD